MARRFVLLLPFAIALGADAWAAPPRAVGPAAPPVRPRRRKCPAAASRAHAGWRGAAHFLGDSGYGQGFSEWGVHG